MTRKPVIDAWERTVYLDEATGEYYEEDEVVDPNAKRVCKSLNEPFPDLATGEYPEEEGRWAYLREVKE